jgi:hypothetical protein
MKVRNRPLSCELIQKSEGVQKGVLLEVLLLNTLKTMYIRIPGGQPILSTT